MLGSFEERQAFLKSKFAINPILNPKKQMRMMIDDDLLTYWHLNWRFHYLL